MNCANCDKIVVLVTERGSDFHAALESNPGIWGCGKSVEIAAQSAIATAISHDFSDNKDDYLVVYQLKN